MARRQRSITSFFGQSPAAKKSKLGSQKKQSIEAKSDQKVACSGDVFTFAVGETWNAALKKEMQKFYFRNLQKFLSKEYASKIIYPPRNQVFNCFEHCALDKVKVVIIGQDPYHGPGQAHGLCFSVCKGIRVPPSLRNIFKEMKTDLNVEPSKHGYLTSWSQQGVLLLNNVLTVIKAKPYSHRKKGWEKFTEAVVRTLNSECERLVFLCWGKAAQDKAKFVDRSRHCVLQSSHPSPLGAHKTSSPFIGSRHFSKANAYLEKHERKPIDWSLPS